MELIRERLQKQSTINPENKNVFLRNNIHNYTPNNLSSKIVSYTINSEPSNSSNLSHLFKSLKKNRIIDSKQYLMIKPLITQRTLPRKLENNNESSKEKIIYTLNNEEDFNKVRFKSIENSTLRKKHLISKYKNIKDNNINKSELKELKPSSYYPSLSIIPKDILIKNSHIENYYGKNILFSKLADLNYRNEIIDLGRKFIRYKNILHLKKSYDKNKIELFEKADTYKILNRVRFTFKSPSDKSKLKYMAESFNTIHSINNY